MKKERSYRGSKFKRVTALKSRRKMPSMAGKTISIMIRQLIKEIGRINTFKLLIKSWIIDLLFNPPEFDETLFELGSERLKKLFREKFRSDGYYLIPVQKNLEKKLGEREARRIMALTTMKAGLPFLAAVFKPIPGIKHINEFRQQMADYLGGVYDGIYEEWISEDGLEVQYKFKRCPHIEIWKAYGMEDMACAACMCDHIIFDNNIPQIVFSRSKTIALGDNYCNHNFRIRESNEKEWIDDPDHIDPMEEIRYMDAYRCRFNARDEIRRARHDFIGNGYKFSFQKNT